MKKYFAIVAAGIALTLTSPLIASADPADRGMTTAEAATTAKLVQRANRLPIETDRKAKSNKSTLTKRDKSALSATAAYGYYPTRKGVILTTSDAYKNLIPTGHTAIIYSAGNVIESVTNGVVIGGNNWYATKSQAYGVTTRATTAAQDARAADWASWQLGKPYNWNYFNLGTRSSFYCSQLVWASFRDNFGINLDTWSYPGAIHPMEFVNNSQTYLVWRKA